jgi:ATP-dependent DNA helicase RecQ
VARVEQRFGVGHVVDVLTGAKTETIRSFRHDRLSTYGLLAHYRKKPLTSMVYQLVDQGLLDRTAGDRPLLKLNAASWEIMRGERTVRMVQPKRDALARTRFDKESWDGVDRGLFDSLRELRRAIAAERGVPPYLVFGDASLRDMARLRPGSNDALLNVHGVGQRKLKDLGPRFLQHIASYCAEHKLSLDAATGGRPRRR